VNKTSHNIFLLQHPDPLAFQSDERKIADTSLEPGEVYQVPILLTEKSLRQPGNHLGSIWLQPNSDAPSAPSLEFFLSQGMGKKGDIEVGFTTRPVQLAKLVSESALLFESQPSYAPLDDASTGVHVCCPVVQGTKRLSPFCYALEVGRSPLVKEQLEVEEQEILKGKRKAHGPVAYTLSIHPTFVIVNLLPERGRFELMHAARKSVVWFADLEPGQQVSIHSVGLDAPLLLLLNLGFCKTPVGEGALVHHGVDPPRGTRGEFGLKTIGKASKAVTKQLGKTLTKIGESPDKRGLEKLLAVQNPQVQSPGIQGKDRETRVTDETQTDLGLDTGKHCAALRLSFFT